MPLPIAQPRQAVAINAYEWADPRRHGARGFRRAHPAADHAEVIGFFEQLESELDAAGFYHPPEEAPSMVRNLRIALGRSNFTPRRCAPCAASSPLSPGSRPGARQAGRQGASDKG